MTVTVQWSSVYVRTPAGRFPAGRINANSYAGSGGTAIHLNSSGSPNTSIPTDALRF